MELKRRVSIGKIYLMLYFVAFSVYFMVGLKPVDATSSASFISIPSIGLSSVVQNLELTDSRLDAPDYIAGSYTKNSNKTLLIGHSTTVFHDLHNIEINDDVVYNNVTYRVSKVELMKKSNISMAKILASEDTDTIVLMTCAGKLYDDGDASHRLIVTALRI